MFVWYDCSDADADAWHAQLTFLPEELLGAMFASDNAWLDAPCAFLVRNMPTDPELPPTPADGRAPPAKRTFVSEAGLVGLTLLKGGVVFGSATEKEGALVHQARTPPAGLGTEAAQVPAALLCQATWTYHRCPATASSPAVC